MHIKMQVGESLTFCICDSKICLRPSTSGLGTTTWRSKRPGRTNALSKDSGKLVAAITMMPSFCLNPSSSTSNWLSVIFMYCWSLGLRLPPIASISSMNMMHGDLQSTWWVQNVFLQGFQKSPKYKNKFIVHLRPI
jgi:hypothetical protein